MVSRSGAKTWLVAYDIRESRRLRRLHRCLKQEGTALQYSAFCVEVDDDELGALLARVRCLIDEQVDDVRAYHVPAHCRVWQLGRQQLPDGVYIEGSEAVRHLLQVSGSQHGAAVSHGGGRAL